jgi:hypothetical protein
VHARFGFGADECHPRSPFELIVRDCSDSDSRIRSLNVGGQGHIPACAIMRGG